MSDNRLDRRKLIGLALMSGSTAAMASSPMSLLSYIQSSEGEARVATIVKKYFPVAPGSDAFLATFYRSLVHSGKHHQDAAYLSKHLESKELEEALEVYVIEAFASSTNYLLVAAGEEPTLRMRKV